MEIRKGWKVLGHREYKGWVSSLIFMDRGQVIYSIGEWTFPACNCGPLCVFDNPLLACEYRWSHLPEYHKDYYFASCDYVPSTEREIWCYRDCAVYKDGGFVLQEMRRPVSLDKLEPGTVLASQVMLTDKPLPYQQFYDKHIYVVDDEAVCL